MERLNIDEENCRKGKEWSGKEWSGKDKKKRQWASESRLKVNIWLLKINQFTSLTLGIETKEPYILSGYCTTGV